MAASTTKSIGKLGKLLRKNERETLAGVAEFTAELRVQDGATAHQFTSLLEVMLKRIGKVEQDEAEKGKKMKFPSVSEISGVLYGELVALTISYRERITQDPMFVDHLALGLSVMQVRLVLGGVFVVGCSTSHLCCVQCRTCRPSTSQNSPPTSSRREGFNNAFPEVMLWHGSSKDGLCGTSGATLDPHRTSTLGSRWRVAVPVTQPSV